MANLLSKHSFPQQLFHLHILPELLRPKTEKVNGQKKNHIAVKDGFRGGNKGAFGGSQITLDGLAVFLVKKFDYD